jgi:hypothetical protein
MHDYFDSELRCPKCGTLHRRNEGNMQTHLRGDPDGTALGVGHLLDPGDLKAEAVRGAGYLLITPPSTEGTLRLLNSWSCYTCNTDQWAIVEILESRISRIEAVSLKRTVLDEANFIGAVDAELLAAAFLDLSSREMRERKLDTVTVLRQHLE